MRGLRSRFRRDSGQSMTEYIVIVAVVVVIAIAVFVVFGDKIKSAFTSAGDSVTGAAGQVDQRIGEH